MKRVLTLLASLLLACIYSPVALAQDGGEVVAPPGNSGVDEYLEVVPGASGDRPAGGGGQTTTTPTQKGNGSEAARKVLGAKTAGALNRLGADGRAAAAVAAATAPANASANSGDNGSKPAKPGTSSKNQSPAQEEQTKPDEDGGGRAQAVAGALAGGGGGIGFGFPLVLLGALAATVGLLAIRRSSRRE